MRTCSYNEVVLYCLIGTLRFTYGTVDGGGGGGGGGAHEWHAQR